MFDEIGNQVPNLLISNEPVVSIRIPPLLAVPFAPIVILFSDLSVMVIDQTKRQTYLELEETG
jgi:hypothetical protein